jgi:hypothetical protein
MRLLISVLTVGLLVVAVSTLTLSAQAKDPRVGVWKLNVAKSTFPNGNPPRSIIRSYEDRGGGLILYKQEVIDGQGNQSVLNTTCKLDGMDYPQATQSAKSVTIAHRLIDAYTVEAVNKLDGKVTGVATQTVSKDGKTLTIKNTDGVIQVFERQ